MLIGILSDIHGNSTALRRVLDEAKKKNVDHLLILGDTIGYYYEAIEVYELLSTWRKNIIRGNHEDLLVEMLDGKLDSDFVRRKYGMALEIAVNTLSLEKIAEIRQYKRTDTFNFNGVDILIGHGTPWSTDEYLYPDADQELLKRCEQIGMDYVFLGHTHYPFIYNGKDSLVINPGSVGQSRVQGGIADWGILNISNKVYTAQQTSYVTDSIKENVKRNDPDVPYLWEILERIR